MGRRKSGRLRQVHTKELAPEIRFRNTLAGKCVHEGHDEGSRSTPLQHVPGGKLPRLQETISSEKICFATKRLLPSFARHFTASKF